MDSYDMEDDVAAEEQQKKKISFRFCHEWYVSTLLAQKIRLTNV